MYGWEPRVLLRHFLEQGLTITAIAERIGCDRRTIQRWVAAGELDRDPAAARYGPRAPVPTKLDPYKPLLRERLTTYPELTAVRLFDEVRAAGYRGSLTQLKVFVRQIRPRPEPAPLVRFETPPGHQAQVDFARFALPWGTRWGLFIVLGYSRLLWLQFYARQTMHTLMRGLEAAFASFGGVPTELLFDQLKAVVVADRRPAGGPVLANPEFLRFAAHWGFRIRTCRPYRAQTKGKVERPVRYVRQSFLYGRSFAGDADLNAQALQWLDAIANVRVHATTHEAPRARFEPSVRRENASFPALVTRTQGPNGRVLRATYNSRGHVLTVTDSGTIVNGQVAVTRYGWNTTWDADTLVVPPENDSTVIGIEAATGHRLWQQDASGSASRVNFTYHPNGLLATIREPGAALVTTLNHDARGNLRETLSPLGFRDSIYTDNLGRDTLTAGPALNAAQAKQRQRKVYDLRDRVIETVTTTPALPYTLSGITPDTTPVNGDTVVVQTNYDREGRPVFVGSETMPDRGAGTTDEVMTYDRAGRLLSKKLGSGPAGFTYDAAGNAITQTYRGPGGATVTTQYDALNRVVQRVTPRRAYPRTDCTGHPAGPLGGNPCLMRFPYFPNIVGDSLEISADTAVFVYDTAGNLVRADNRYAQVRRSYHPNGLLATDTLRLRNYASSVFGSHAYHLRYGYDRNGRRGWMTLGGNAGSDSLSYLYSPANGALAHVIDAANRRYTLTYTPAGRIDSLKVYPNAGAYPNSPGIRESHQYDADGRMTRRERRVGSGGGTGLQLDSLWYDARGKVSKAVTSSAAESQGSLATMLAYAGLGAVVASHVQSSSSPYWNLEEFRTDGVGNVWYQHTRYAASSAFPSSLSSYSANGLLQRRVGGFPEGCGQGTPHVDSLYQLGDLQGNVIRAGELRNSGCDNHASDRQTATNSYYSADNRLAVVQRYNSQGAHSWEEYWYDALGRRVLTRARHELPTCSYQAGCAPFVERTVWDGDQLLVEQRTSGLDLISGGAPDHGTVRYVHMLGIDQPVAVLDNRFTGARVLHYNWRGLAEASSWADGAPADVEVGGATTIAWPAGQGIYFREVSPSSPTPPTWIGSLPANGSGTAGLLYRRNRYYDPASGRFTQEDPIGLAGGLNLYGFAGGDPVNFSDPFGLCPEIPALCAVIGANAGQRAAEYWASQAITSSGARRAFATGMGLLASLWTPDTWQPTAATLLGALAASRASVSCACVGEDDTDQDLTRRNPDGSRKEPGQQYEELTEAQKRDPAKIHSTKKSRQRDQSEIEEEAQRALEESRRKREPD